QIKKPRNVGDRPGPSVIGRIPLDLLNFFSINGQFLRELFDGQLLGATRQSHERAKGHGQWWFGGLSLRGRKWGRSNDEIIIQRILNHSRVPLPVRAISYSHTVHPVLEVRSASSCAAR